MPRPLPAIVAPLAATALLLTGCTSSPGLVTVTPRATATTRPVAAATPSAKPPAQHPATATPVSIPCAELVPLALTRTIGREYAGVPGYAPSPGSPAARLAALHGTVCAWKDASSGHLLEVAVAKPSTADDLAMKNDLVDRSNSVPTYGVEGYFDATGGVGEADAFPGAYWVFARSADLYEPGDAATIVTAVRTSLWRHR
ncbi:hypothetical protein QDR37_14235 [Amnibacterium sp. CER49]|uniref:hypothetical protein n=1 Tax=Amnibacterium sp. CER49 TaxID=3039161 RepID=UPI0024491C48|nr:hypothetical protein [Amnibacterium sp. CER49]MDH2445109.1 hypothetical protein [Amnibacterium sp. CER49]